MKKNYFRRTLSFLCVLVMLMAVIAPMTVGASAASAEQTVSGSISGIEVNTSKNFYTVKSSATLRSSGIFYRKLAVLNKGSLVQISGESGNFYNVKLSMDGKSTTYYIKKSEVKKAPASSVASFVYTTKNAPLRSAPCAEGTKITTVSKGSVLYSIGKMTNDSGNIWYFVLTDSGKIGYIYGGNVKTASKITLSISGDGFVSTGTPEDLKCTVTPAGIKGVTWSSSNTAVATVDSGKVNGVAGGDTVITAKLGDLVSVSMKVNVSLGVKVYRQTENYTCSAAASLAVLRYNGKCMNTKDKDLYSKKISGGFVYKIVNVLNSHLGNNTYRWKIINNFDTYEQAVRKSLAQNSPVIARVGVKNKYFNYTASCHYTTVIGLYDKDGETWAICVDSFANRFKNNDYTDAATGIVHVPLEILFKYNSCGGGDRYLIYNP